LSHIVADAFAALFERINNAALFHQGFTVVNVRKRLSTGRMRQSDLFAEWDAALNALGIVGRARLILTSLSESIALVICISRQLPTGIPPLARSYTSGGLLMSANGRHT